MLLVLPPSETKSVGGDGAPLDFHALSFPSLTDIRIDIANDVCALSANREAAMAALKLGPKLAGEIDANAALFTSPTTAAVFRYTGVLFDALDAPTLPNYATSRIAIGSALFGIVAASDPIPHYRLSGTTKLPPRVGGAAPTMRARWGRAITDVLSQEDFVIDLRSGTYAALGRVKGAVTATVLTREGKVVSHFNKHHKGVLARELALAPEAATNVDEAVDIARAAGMKASVVDGGIHIVLD